MTSSLSNFASNTRHQYYYLIQSEQEGQSIDTKRLCLTGIHLLLIILIGNQLQEGLLVLTDTVKTRAGQIIHLDACHYLTEFYEISPTKS